MQCYTAYHELQEIVEAIDDTSSASAQMQNFRGSGQVGEPDFMYGSIRHTPVEEETLVGLQHKFLFMLKLIQSADDKVSTQAVAGVEQLNTSFAGMKARWEKLR